MQLRSKSKDLAILDRMRLSISTRIFLALTLLSLVILGLSAAVTRWNFQRGFLDYVAAQEADTVNDAVLELAAIYEQEGNWESLRDNPRRWNELLRGGKEPFPRRPPGGGQPGINREPHLPPPPDTVDVRRMALLDADGQIVVGPHRSSESDNTVAIVVDGIPAGFVAVAPRRQLTNPADQRFAEEQARSIYLIAAAALLIAAAIAAVLARQLTRPVRILANSTRAIAAGHLDTRVVATNNDELGDLAQDFNRLAETLETNRDSRQRWVADIAHELRTPLAVLKGELDAVEDGVREFNATTRASLQAEVARLIQLVGDLHDLSVHDDGALNYRPEQIDIGTLVRTTLGNAEQRLQNVGIALTLDVADETSAFADPTRIEQLLTNLVENTIRYTDAPGSLIVTCKQDSGGVEISFADSAPSVPASALTHLFERLYRVETSRNRDSGGSGLGLSICKAIVEAHNGTIEAAHSDAGGLLISIRLPLRRATGETS